MGGALLVGQSGGPTAVVNSTLVGVIETALRQPAVTRVLGMRHGVEGLLRGEIVDLGRIPRPILARLRSTPGAALGSCRYAVTDEDFERVLEIIRAHRVRYFLYIGGNGSALTTLRLSQLAAASGYELGCVGVPKTIDNDIVLTDHTPGYGSAARYYAVATMEAGLDTLAMSSFDRVKFFETMGRHTGWLAAATALGRRDERDAPHLVYVPERSFVLEQMLDDIQRVLDRLDGCVVAVSEGVRDPSGELVAASHAAIDRDSFGRPQVGGVGEYLARVTSERLKVKTRCDKPGTLGRVCGAQASRLDREEAYRVGQAAVEAAIAGADGQMVAIEREPEAEYRARISLVPLAEVAGHERPLPEEFVAPPDRFPTAAYRAYALPLLGDPLPDYEFLEVPA